MSPLSVADALEEAGADPILAASLLWRLDVNRLVPSDHYVITPQQRTQHRGDDAARIPLIPRMSDDVWEKPTFRSFKKLLDNYVSESGMPETVSDEERAEEQRFLDSICETPCIQFLFEWQLANGLDPAESMNDFKNRLHDIWFAMSNRGRTRDSSGFEHVFCGELDDGKVKGLHNFIQVYTEEQRSNFDYMGYLDIRGEPSDAPPPVNQQILIIRFEWLGHLKSVSSMFVGTSPEFEIALYTLFFITEHGGSTVKLGPYTAVIEVYSYRGKISTSFPELKDVDLDSLEQTSADQHDSLHKGDTSNEEQAFDGNALEDTDEFPPLA